ncbi:hypothetical protein BU23DRAFT_277108 [Bimuria novae-zelandiae CBS 107.79]|uniref:BHLH domain-containing protein n=1 Tax=Bimuria novae-zelandiae CBS 107.79 TaxID=1447943 RepID=A0A6A5VN89_9PLEO|nr:hypothetical protein BU23DRAFT_277108 [Bimuria novae-zelandiae CBS 107.79]
MSEKDPPPFGYQFTADFFGGSAHDFDNPAPPLLNDVEQQRLQDFFLHAGPYESGPDAPPFAFQPDAPDLFDEFSGWSAVPPATIHNISTTIPDQALLHGYHTEQAFAPQQSNSHFATTDADLQAASTLYTQAQIPHAVPTYQPSGRSHSFHAVPSAGLHTNGFEPNGLPNSPMSMLPSSNSLTHEQLASLIPSHDVPGSIDASITPQYANGAARMTHEAGLQQRARPSFKRAYTYGTDTSFNESGFQPSSTEESEERVTKRLLRELAHAQPLARPISGTTKGAMVTLPQQGDSESNDEDASDDSSPDDDEEIRQRKRRKRPPPTTNGKRKSVSGQGSNKSRKISVDDRVKKPRRKSMVGQKQQRENLTEEQKRSNHILSEQKRRNLIKRGFDDLHDLVPEIRNGGLSKSGVLNEAANFLEQLIEDNKRYAAILSEDR